MDMPASPRTLGVDADRFSEESECLGVFRRRWVVDEAVIGGPGCERGCCEGRAEGFPKSYGDGKESGALLGGDWPLCSETEAMISSLVGFSKSVVKSESCRNREAYLSFNL